MDLWTGNPNMEAFHRMEKRLLREHYRKVAVFCDGKLLCIGRDLRDALRRARVPPGKEIFVRELLRPGEQTQAVLAAR